MPRIQSDIQPGILTDIIRTKEYIDMDALESAIYHGDISNDVVKTFSSCKDITETQVLNISKRKEKKDE